MSKVLEATCAVGVVESEGVPVPVAEIFSEGVGPSEGVLIVDKEKAFYIAKTSPDLDATLAQINAALTQTATAISLIATALTAIGAGMTGPTTAPPPTLAAQVAAITATGVQVTAANTLLQTLKAMLR